MIYLAQRLKVRGGQSKPFRKGGAFDLFTSDLHPS
jgi:hypothetical protein